MSPLDFTPEGPDWALDWAGIDAAFGWVRRMAGCPQDPLWHAEGDVWIHTRMVLEALVALPGWRALPAEERRTVFAAALLHDVAKPDVTREEDGRITSRGHSRRGAVDARRLLWELGVPFAQREAICALVLSHQLPFFLLDRDGSKRAAIRLSWTLRCDWLALVAEADARGREAADQRRLVENVLLFAEYCEELGITSAPWGFASDHTRVLYFRSPERYEGAPAYDDTRLTVTLMSGLPGAGKDTWLATHAPELPVVSLDALRTELGVDPADHGAQGHVLAAARERAREHLRAGRDFAWNATNIARDLRGRCLGLFADYKARTRIVYVEAGAEALYEQNRARADAVPERVIERMLRRWSPPDLTEAHELMVVAD
jgi:predicted kinase